MMSQPGVDDSVPARPQRILMLISAEPTVQMRSAIAAGAQPRRDFDAIQMAADATMVTPALAQGGLAGRALHRLAGKGVALAWEGFRRRRQYDVIYSDGEGVGIPLAMLLRLDRRRAGRARHVCLTHYLSSPKKRVWFRLGVARRMDTVIVHSTAQATLATEALGLPAQRVARLPYFVDERFWRTPTDFAFVSTREAPGPIICSVGLEFRDYTTLLAAIRDLAVQVRIGAASHWSHHSAFAGSPQLPRNVSIRAYDYQTLRALYAAARFVVVPLLDVDNQAGVTTILEAMAMGKAVVVTQTRGQTDVVRDWRAGPDTPPPGFLAAPDYAATLGALPTGCYVRPGDADDLRETITYLLDHPEHANELGRNGRRVVEGVFGLDAFAQRFAHVLRATPQREATPAT